jgi:ligand-binding sensor domain-containing protein
MKYAYLLCLLLVFCTSKKEQPLSDPPNNKTKSEVRSTPRGPKSIVRSVKQGRNGIIWIASWEGIFRYDGASFTNITRNVTSARFFSILEDRKGNMWFGSIGSGVYFYDGRSFQNFTIHDGLINNEISCIYEDKVGNIWFGANGGASRYDGKSFQNYTVNENVMAEDRTGKSLPDVRPDKPVTSILQDKTGKIWFGTRNNIFIFDGRNFTVVSNKGKSFTNVWMILEDKNGNVWFNAGGLWRFDGTTFTNFSQSSALSFFEDFEGNIWTTSTNQMSDQESVLLRYDAKSLKNNKPVATEIKPAVGIIFSISQAYDGTIWLGADNGVYRYDGKTVYDFKD